MNSADTILPDSVAIFRNIEAFDLAAKQSLDRIPLETLLVYLIDQVDADALPLLAQQFDVLGFKGWRLATTDADKRSLIKRAIELHRYKGTVWAVKEAMKSVGFEDVILTEHVDGHWANFQVEIINRDSTISAASIAELTAMIEEYKNARSNLVRVFISLDLLDEIVLTDDTGLAEDITINDAVYLASALFYDGAGNYDGTYDHSGDSDLITFEPI